MTLEDYFAKNGIRKKQLFDATPDQRIVPLVAENDYFQEFFKTDLDSFIDCVDYDLNMRLFDAALREIAPFDDILEPCCMSGIFGCYIAQHKKHYTGVDILPIAIEKAQKRAVDNGLSPAIFRAGDVKHLTKKHEAIVGRYVVNTHDYDVDYTMISALARLSDTIVLIGAVNPEERTYRYHEYSDAFKQHGFGFSIAEEGGSSAVTHAYTFLLKATRKV